MINEKLYAEAVRLLSSMDPAIQKAVVALSEVCAAEKVNAVVLVHRKSPEGVSLFRVGWFVPDGMDPAALLSEATEFAARAVESMRQRGASAVAPVPVGADTFKQNIWLPAGPKN